jgi:hypothetical protein
LDCRPVRAPSVRGDGVENANAKARASGRALRREGVRLGYIERVPFVGQRLESDALVAGVRLAVVVPAGNDRIGDAGRERAAAAAAVEVPAH